MLFLRSMLNPDGGGKLQSEIWKGADRPRPRIAGTHDALVVKLLVARGVPKAYIEVDTSKSKR